MSDHILKTIEQAKDEIRKHEEAVVSNKKLINQLCGFAGLPQEYQDAELQVASTVAVTIRRNVFFGRPLATCVREYLELRKDKPVKEATLDEIIDALETGGFDFTKISEDPNQYKRGLAITLAKNPQFHRLPNADWGLLSWYPNIKRSKEKSANDDSEDETVVGSDQARENKEKREREEADQEAAELVAQAEPPQRKVGRPPKAETPVPTK
jgi:DNA-directed RNA polymerase delta subunit